MPPKETKTISVRIAGLDHRIRGEASRAYMEHLAQLIDGKIAGVMEKTPNMTKTRAAILVSLNLADELEKLKKEYKDLVELMEEAR